MQQRVCDFKGIGLRFTEFFQALLTFSLLRANYQHRQCSVMLSGAKHLSRRLQMLRSAQHDNPGFGR
jgi:hypothetical protein